MLDLKLCNPCCTYKQGDENLERIPPEADLGVWAYFRHSCKEQGTGFDDLPWSLPIWDIIWFYESFTFVS